MVAFDTLKASQRLRKAGFPEDQANALVSAFAEDIGANLATKDDIALLRKDFDVLRHDVASDIESLRESMERENAVLRKDFANEMAALRTDFTSETAALRTDVASQVAVQQRELANQTAALRKDFASERELLLKEISLRVALGFTGATTLILAAIGAATGIIVALT